MQVEESDLIKIHDALQQCVRFLQQRDAMNATMHLAQVVRFSPLTSTAEAELNRLKKILESGKFWSHSKNG